MSINFHAYQSRGYLFESYEAQCEQWRKMFKGYDPARAAKILDLKCDEKFVYLIYYQEDYRLDLTEGIIEKKLNGVWTSQVYFNEAMSIYHLLYYVKDEPGVSGEWIPNESLDSRRRSGHAADILTETFSKYFEGNCERLEQVCKKLGGKLLKKGDVGYEFQAFPHIPIQMIFWDKDDEFSAQTQILVDSRITDYVHFETTGCIVSDLLERLEQMDKNMTEFMNILK